MIDLYFKNRCDETHNPRIWSVQTISGQGTRTPPTMDAYTVRNEGVCIRKRKEFGWWLPGILSRREIPKFLLRKTKVQNKSILLYTTLVGKVFGHEGSLENRWREWLSLVSFSTHFCQFQFIFLRLLSFDTVQSFTVTKYAPSQSSFGVLARKFC